MDTDARGAFDCLRADVRAVDNRVSALDDRLKTFEERLRQEIREAGAATRRHIDVVAESLRDHIPLIAEGLIALDANVEGMRRA